MDASAASPAPPLPAPMMPPALPAAGPAPLVRAAAEQVVAPGPSASSSEGSAVPSALVVRPGAGGLARALSAGDSFVGLFLLPLLSAFTALLLVMGATGSVLLSGLGMLATALAVGAGAGRVVDRSTVSLLPVEAAAFSATDRALARVGHLAARDPLAGVVPPTLLPELLVHRSRAFALADELAGLRSQLERSTEHPCEVGVVASTSQPALALLLTRIEATREALLAQLSYVTSCRTEVEELHLRLSALPADAVLDSALDVVDPLEQLRSLNRAAAEVVPL